MITGLFIYFTFILCPVIAAKILHKLYKKDRSFRKLLEDIENGSDKNKIRHVANLRELNTYAQIATDLVKGDTVFVESECNVYIYHHGVFSLCVNRFSLEYSKKHTFKPNKYLVSELGIFIDI